MAKDTAPSFEPGDMLGRSPWLRVEQTDIDVFGAATKDLEPLHNDPAWCAENSPFGRPIAYGFQTLSLLTYLFYEATDGAFGGGRHTTNFPINYGFERVRLITPVTVGSEIRGAFRLLQSDERQPGELLLTIEATVEIRGLERPALVAEWLFIWVTGDGRQSVARSIRTAAAE